MRSGVVNDLVKLIIPLPPWAPPPDTKYLKYKCNPVDM